MSMLVAWVECKVWKLVMDVVNGANDQVTEGMESWCFGSWR